jgi:hypothetical protein
MLAEERRPNEVAPSGTTNARMLVRVRNAYWEAAAMALDALPRTTASPSALHPINVKVMVAGTADGSADDLLVMWTVTVTAAVSMASMATPVRTSSGVSGQTWLAHAWTGREPHRSGTTASAAVANPNVA